MSSSVADYGIIPQQNGFVNTFFEKNKIFFIFSGIYIIGAGKAFIKKGFPAQKAVIR